MIEGPITRGGVFKHTKTGVDYTVKFCTNDDTGALTYSKIGDGDWQYAVVYFDPLRAHMTFIRDEFTFRKNFERVSKS